MKQPLTVIDHPVAADKLTRLRDPEADRIRVRQLVYELGLLLAVEATRTCEAIKGEAVGVDGQAYPGRVMPDGGVVVLSLLRGGLLMGEAFAAVLPAARTGHLGIHHQYGGEKDPLVYLVAVPTTTESTSIFILDCVLGTGQTMLRAMDEIRRLDIPPGKCRVAVLSANRDGLDAFYADESNADVPVFTFETIDRLDDEGLPVFGFGDITDRIYETA